jgi:purine-binding chemotaxis protein CheW
MARMSNEVSVATPDKTAMATAEQYLTFMLAGEEYGIDILRVQEIKGWDRVTRIPHAPDYVLGVINLRGTVVPVLDLRRRFGIETIPFGPTTVVIVIRVGGGRADKTVGIVVDAVSEVYNVTPGSSRPPPDMGGSVDTAFVKALATVDDKMIILLDVDRIAGSTVGEAAAAPSVVAA